MITYWAGNFVPTSPIGVVKTSEFSESNNRLTNCALAKLQFFLYILLYEYHSLCKATIFVLSTADNTLFAHFFAAKFEKHQIILF